MDNIKSAIKAMCQSMSGGYAAMAAALGLSSRAALENRIYEVKGQRVSTEEAMMMQRIADSTAFAEAVAAESGGVFVPLPEAAEFAEEDIQAAFMSLSEEVGELVGDWREATADGELSPAEMRRLREAKRRVCSHAAAIVALTRKYYTAGE